MPPSSRPSRSRSCVRRSRSAPSPGRWSRASPSQAQQAGTTLRFALHEPTRSARGIAAGSSRSSGTCSPTRLKHAGGATVDVEVERTDDAARLRVRDTGRGIAEQDQQRIFHRFERSAPARRGGGLGLGLWLSRAIVEAHGGTLTVESAPGAGATFVVSLPLGDARALGLASVRGGAPSGRDRGPASVAGVERLPGVGIRNRTSGFQARRAVRPPAREVCLFRATLTASLLAALLFGCGQGAETSDVGGALATGSGWSSSTGGSSGGRAARPPGPGGTTAPLAFQPGFHQALRWSESTGGLVTFRMKVPVHRTGGRVRVTFKSGTAGLEIQRATVAKAGPAGALAGAPVELTFAGKAGGSVAAKSLLMSDPAAFPVQAGDELAVSFEANGAVAASAIANFPGSYARTGSYAIQTAALGGSSHPRAVGVFTVDVEGPKGRAAVALGDSITEGYVEGPSTSGTSLSSGYLTAVDDYRHAWSAVASSLLGGPVVNAGVSGQGTWDAAQNLPQEVFSLEGITDCVVLLGTNDLGGSLNATQVEARLQGIFDQLAPFCRVWAGTLLPKERTSAGTLAQVQADRKTVNAWLRTSAKVYRVIDFEAATRAASSPDLYAIGYGMDGIHPTVAGQAAVGEAAAKALAGGFGDARHRLAHAVAAGLPRTRTCV